MPAFIDEVLRIATRFGNSEAESPACGDDHCAGMGERVWEKTAPKLAKALVPFERNSYGTLPNRSHFRESRESNQKEIDQIIDAVIHILECSDATQDRDMIRSLQSEISESRLRIAGLREELISAPPAASLSLPYSVWTRSRESLEGAIAAELQQVETLRSQIQELKFHFHASLQTIRH